MAIVRVSLFLALICLISAATLSATYEVTMPVIQKNEAKKLQESLARVIPGATVFASGKFADRVVNVGFGADGQVSGCAMITAPLGYAGPIKMLVGLDRDGRFHRYLIQDMAETPGLGTKAREAKFKEQPGWAAVDPEHPPKVKKDGGGIDAITAATISSRAVCRGVEEALELFKTHREAILALRADGGGTPPPAPVESPAPAPEGGNQ